MEGQKLRASLAQQAYDEAKDKNTAEKTIYVSEETFMACLTDKNPHHTKCIIGKGFLRTYHEAFWTEDKNDLGRTYNHGIVHVVNKDSEVNRTYTINDYDLNNFEQVLSEAIGVKRHRLVSIHATYDNIIVAKLTPQRNNFDD